MGLDLDRDQFTEDEYARFSTRLEQSVEALARLLDRPGFGTGPPSIGGELELCLIDRAGRPLPINAAVLADMRAPTVQLECDRFNMEIATRPLPLAGRAFTGLGTELEDALATIRTHSAKQGARVAVIGILPTLREQDLTSEVLTQTHRYRAMSAGLKRLRQAPFEVEIAGEDRLRLRWDDVTLEGATTSWQIHLKVAPPDYARTYNAAQVATAPVLAVGVNSPTFLGQRLWDETRIALFRQAVDDRANASNDDWRPARVSFGHGWVRKGAHELFAESVALHPPLVAALSDEDPLVAIADGGVPKLREFRLHHGTVWHWNRAVFDPVDGGHLRIEMRALPAGPTIVDMLANAAFQLGLTLALARDAERLVTALTFGQARRNFYSAAQRGLDAELLWPSDPPSPQLVPARTLIPRLLLLARSGLVEAQVDAREADHLLAIVAARVESGQTGAQWQRRTLARLDAGRSRDEALAAMLERYLALTSSGEPIHTWPTA